MIRRIAASLMLCLLAFLATPVLADTASPEPPADFAVVGAASVPSWSIGPALSATYTLQEVDAEGNVVRESVVSPAGGIDFWRTGSWFGFQVGALPLPDEEQRIPRIAPFAAIELGGDSYKWLFGVLRDPQSADGHAWQMLTGGTFAF